MPNRPRASTLVLAALTLALGAGWITREVAFARQQAQALASKTVTLGQVAMKDYQVESGETVGQVGVYVDGDTPGSTKFVTGRFVLQPGKSPHPPHQHVEEEVMVIESGTGEIFVDGKTTPVGPGSVMYTTPQASHGIVNTGAEPIVFYFIKWAGKPTR